MKISTLQTSGSVRPFPWLFVPLILLVGCGGDSPFHAASIGAPNSSPVSGTVRGGQFPITNSSVQLYAAGDTGYGAGATALLTTPVYTDQNGDFSIPAGSFTCPANNPETYVVAVGGSPGAGEGNNFAIRLMAPLGPCQNPTYSYQFVNEVTTIASVWPLAPFMSYGAQVGTAPGNTAGLVTAFTNIGYLVNSQGQSPGSGVPQGITVPSAEINTMANILASCVNSSGTAACNALFAGTTPPDGIAPQNTCDAALNMVLYPSQNLASLFALPTPQSPFGPALSSAPASWSLGNAIIDNPVPAISSLSPAYLSTASAPQTLTINGSGFLASSTVTFNGNSHAATYISSSQLTIALTSADLSSFGSDPVVVSNPVPGGGTSNVVTFYVTLATPAIVNTLPVAPAGYQGNGIAVQGSMAYISTEGIGNQSGARSLVIVSLASPAAPTVISTTSSGIALDMTGIAVSGNYAYVPFEAGSGTDFEVWNVSNPQSPFVAGSASISCPTNFYQFYAPVVDGNYVYVSCFASETTTTGTIVVVNVSNPAAPSVIESVSVTSTYQPISLAIWEQNLYVVETQGGSSSDYVLLYSLQAPAAPFLLGWQSVPHSPQWVAAQGTTALVPIYDSTELEIIDFSNPSSPQTNSVSLGSCNPLQVAVSLASVAIVPCNSGGVAEVNLSSPATYLGSALSGTAFNFLVPSANYLYGVDENGNLETIEF